MVSSQKKKSRFERFLYLLDAKHRRDKCMDCSAKPDYEVLWAEGMAHAWFCEKHLKEWLKDQVAECAEEGFSNKNCGVNSVKKLDNKEASKKFGENKNGNILYSFLSKITMPGVSKEKKKELEEDLSKRDCAICDLEECTEECFNAHPGSMIALSKLLASCGAKPYIISNESSELAPVNPSGVEIGEELELNELLKYFKSFYRTKPYVSLVGGLCTQGKTKGDIDVFIRSETRDIATEFRIIRMFPEKYWHRFTFHYPSDVEKHPGIFTNFMDVLNEKIELISSPQLELMSSQKKLSVKLFEFAPLLKPAHGRYKGEEYNVDDLLEIINAKPEWYENKIAVQVKYDGIHVRADHGKDGKVVVWTEEGNVISNDKIPTIVSELKTICKGHDVAVVGELESWENGKHMARQLTTGIIHSKGIHEKEKTLKLFIFDCLYYK